MRLMTFCLCRCRLKRSQLIIICLPQSSLGSKPRIGSNSVSMSVSKRPSVNGRGFTVGDCGFSSESQRDHCIICGFSSASLSASLSAFLSALSSQNSPPSPLSHAALERGKSSTTASCAQARESALILEEATIVHMGCQRGPSLRSG